MLTTHGLPSPAHAPPPRAGAGVGVEKGVGGDPELPMYSVQALEKQVIAPFTPAIGRLGNGGGGNDDEDMWRQRGEGKT